MTGKKIDGFYATVFKHADLLLKPEDEPILRFLKKIDIQTEAKDQPISRDVLKLQFEANDHFDNEELVVTVEYKDDLAQKSTGTVINWKEGKNITTKKPNAKKEKKNKKQKEKIKKDLKLSFFDIFGNFKGQDEAVDADKNPLPCLMFVTEIIAAIGDVAGEDSLAYYLDCVHFEDEEGLGLDAEGDDDEFEDVVEDKEVRKRKESTKSGKSKGKQSAKGKSRKNTEEEVKIPDEVNKEECKQN